MNQRAIQWEANEELAGLLCRYYRGEGGLWGEIQAHVHANLQRQGLPVAPRHLRFRATQTGYLVIIEDAEGYANL
ncbi:hypothetical protein EKD04_003475 [Chloroflexales bacterium ZM16-3]|nr:hypothetical protein [Chloroflexales bacterium ZM16-3]